MRLILSALLSLLPAVSALAQVQPLDPGGTEEPVAPRARPKARPAAEPQPEAPKPAAPRAAPEETTPATPAPSAQESESETPWILRWMLKDRPRGMLVRLPILDTDPNRGTTVGFMPIWILKEPGASRIETIHAPSVTYNQVFGPIPTYRYYYYPTDESSLLMRLAASAQIEREAMALFEDEQFLGKDMKFYSKIQYNIDGARRFFGLGPDSAKSKETNFAEDYIRAELSVGVPIRKGTNWKIHGYNFFQAWRTWNGKTPNLAPFRDTFPGVGPSRRQQTNIIGAKVTYDSRDHGVTTSRGTYLETRFETSKRGLLGAHDFQRYGLDFRHYHVHSEDTDHTTALQVEFDQQLANAPFWLQSALGGKYSLRAYGDGRYVDRGAASLNLEHRVSLLKIPLAGVTTEFEIAPFMGVGTVFDTPGKARKRFARPVYGLALRAVARPQVVGSIDFGYGQEGLAAFIDINYAF